MLVILSKHNMTTGNKGKENSYYGPPLKNSWGTFKYNITCMIVVSHEVIENHNILKKLPQKLQTSILPIEWKVKKKHLKKLVYICGRSHLVLVKKKHFHTWLKLPKLQNYSRLLVFVVKCDQTVWWRRQVNWPDRTISCSLTDKLGYSGNN